MKSNTNECYSKINFVLYKAYEILNDINSDDDNPIVIQEIKKYIKKSFIFNQNKNKKK